MALQSPSLPTLTSPPTGPNRNRKISRPTPGILDRAVTKVQEASPAADHQVLRIEERNKHSIKNAEAGAVHHAGLYFVNKITHAQVMNYGRHMMFDMIVPEPAALFRTLFAKKQAEDDQLKPVKPNITPNSIGRKRLGGLLRADGILERGELVSDETASVQLAFSHHLGNPESGEAAGFSSHELETPEIPAGYRARTEGARL